MNQKTQYVFSWKETFLFFGKIIAIPFLLMLVANIFSYGDMSLYDALLLAGVISGAIVLGSAFITIVVYLEMRGERKQTEREERSQMGDTMYESCENISSVKYSSHMPQFRSRIFRWIFQNTSRGNKQEDGEHKELK